MINFTSKTRYYMSISPTDMRTVGKSCKLNDLNFYDYINDVLTRLMKGETDYKSLIPCNYKPLPSAEEQQEWLKEPLNKENQIF